MKPVSSGVFFLVLCMAGLVSAAEPEVESIDYAHPDVYREYPDSLGDRQAILTHGATLKGKSDLDTIRNVVNWMAANLKYDGKIAYKWRNYDDVMQNRVYGGCADYSIVCGVLLKAAGIPTVWVKTMDVAWIWDFKKGRPFSSWSGHVFLEVYVNGKWALLDPGGKTLYQNYSPQMRIVPGPRFAYHKGNDPKAMIMSLQWEPWKKQTEAYFRKLDVSLLPVDEKGKTSLAESRGTSSHETSLAGSAGTADVRKVYVIGNSPYYQTMSAMAAESKLQVAKSFNCGYDGFLPQAQGHIILIETHNGKPIVAKEVLEKYYPNAYAGISRPARSIRIKGTTIVFLEFSEQLQSLSKLGSSKGEGTAVETNAVEGE
jgi:hypothetical protein